MNMKFQFIKPRQFLNVALAIACVSHIGINAYYELYPDIPSMKQYKADLEKIVFPVSFTICVRELFNLTERYKAFGYKRDWEFYNGESQIREGVFGWNGDFENGSSLTVKGIRELILELKGLILGLRGLILGLRGLIWG